jgi:hypothetical protein
MFLPRSTGSILKGRVMWGRGLLAAAVLVSVTCKGKAGEPGDVQDFLQRDCSAPVGTTNYNFCVGFVAGVEGMMAINNSVDDEGQIPSFLKVCFASPEAAPTSGAAVQVFINWATAHPNKWHYPAQAGVAEALATAWPCKR